MRPFQNEVNAFVGEIWSSMLGLEVHPDDRAMALSRLDDAIISRVSITGHWRGTVTIHCDPRLARDLAAVMFGLRPEATSGDLIEDALGELTNMTSGSYKSLLPGPCYLSLPSAGRLEAVSPDEATDHDLGQFGFNCLDGFFLVTVESRAKRP
jgi:hypothetical protein